MCGSISERHSHQGGWEMRQRAFFLALIFVFGLSAPAMALDPAAAEQKADEIRQLAESDVIYSQEATKALYYQNIQMIDLLKQIRDLLQENLDKIAKTQS